VAQKLNCQQGGHFTYLALTLHFTTSQAKAWVSQMQSPDVLTMDLDREIVTI
jgi:hypothetical protein